MPVPKVDVVILGLIAGSPCHGYELRERMRDRSMDAWLQVGKASVYQALHRLETAGLVAGRAEAGVEGPDRRVYRITRRGRARLRTGVLERFATADAVETPVALAIAFANALEPDEVREGIVTHERALRERRERLVAAVEHASSTGGGTLVTAVLEHQEAIAAAELAWLARVRRGLGRYHR